MPTFCPVQAKQELVWVGAVQYPAGSWEAKQAAGAAAAASKTAAFKQVCIWGCFTIVQRNLVPLPGWPELLGCC